MARTIPMNRLLNGDVGSGTTAGAAAAVAMTHASGLQAVVMAPTEILARQHLGKFRSYLEASFPDLKVDLLISGLPAAERRRVTMSVASGQTALLVGTHALIEERVEILNLGLAVVDEQHRFGTRQRELLRAKGRGRPHFLAMTATPMVEVGVDVPNATVMMIEGADRFGLAQLHQFRGRVGRGAHRSFCLLLAEDPSEPARDRLQLVAREHDGFKLAEEDLRVRGAG